MRDQPVQKGGTSENFWQRVTEQEQENQERDPGSHGMSCRDMKGVFSSQTEC